MSIPFVRTVGTLPRGRYRCSLDEVRQEFVDSAWATASSTRGAVWDDFLKLLDLYDAISADLVESIWLGGSFITSKTDPDDIDVTLLIRKRAFDALSNTKRGAVRKLGGRAAPLVSHVRHHHGLRVDPFNLVCSQIALPFGDDLLTEEERGYLQSRGTWDDWWQRSRSVGAASPSTADAEPVRGYLEVFR